LRPHTQLKTIKVNANAPTRTPNLPAMAILHRWQAWAGAAVPQ
jgi:hypothetical protein